MTIKRSQGLRDKLNGAIANLVSNGTFNVDTGNPTNVTNYTGYTATSAVLSTAADGSTARSLKVTVSSGTFGYASYSITTRVGRMYMLTYGIKKDASSNSCSVRVGAVQGDQTTDNMQSAEYTDQVWTNKAHAFIATGTTTILNFFVIGSSSTYSNFENIAVNEIFDGFRSVMKGCKANIYSGSQPSSANTGVSNSQLLCQITGPSGAGLTFASSAEGVLSKDTPVWSGTCSASGTPAFYRFFEEGDDPTTTSTTAARFDGVVKPASLVAPGDNTDGFMVIASSSLASGTSQEVTAFTYTSVAST